MQIGEPPGRRTKGGQVEESEERANASNSIILEFQRPAQPQLAPTLADCHSHLARILEGKARQEAKEQQQHQHHHTVVDVQKIILGQTAVEDETEETHDEEKTDSSDSVDFGLGPSDDSIRASLSQLSNLSQLFGVSLPLFSLQDP